MKQITTFYLDGKLYGIEVMDVQEVTMQVEITPVLHSSKYVKGLINMRGRVMTAIDLAEAFKIEAKSDEFMTIVCDYRGDAYSLIVDKVGDVINVVEGNEKTIPKHEGDHLAELVSSIYQYEEQLIRIVKIENIISLIEKNTRMEAA